MHTIPHNKEEKVNFLYVHDPFNLVCIVFDPLILIMHIADKNCLPHRRQQQLPTATERTKPITELEQAAALPPPTGWVNGSLVLRRP